MKSALNVPKYSVVKGSISPPWLEKFWYFRSLEWLNIHSNQSTMVGEILGFQVFRIVKYSF